MKILDIFLIIFFVSLIESKVFAEEKESFDGTGGRENHNFLKAKNSNFKKGNDALKQSEKLKKKNKIKKSNKRLNDAIKYFVKANEDYPDNFEILNFLGLSYGKAGDLNMSEIYYQEALIIEPKNSTINFRLGKLYLNSNKIGLARERLEVLKFCNCKEYDDLQNIIKNFKSKN